MSAEMLMKVNEFASNVRDGVIELQPQPSEVVVRSFYYYLDRYIEFENFR